MRCALYTDCPPDECRTELESCLATGLLGGLPWTHLVAESCDAAGELVGFVEVALRAMVPGCSSSHPVGYLEGWWVAVPLRRRGLGRSLVDAAIEWALGHGCNEFASDCALENDVSAQAHAALGFEEIERAILFRRSIA